MGSRVAADAKNLRLDASVRALTYVFMLLQRADGRSHFGPYLRAIPVRHTDPMGWSAAELALLRGSNLLPQQRRRKSELRADFDGTVRPLSEAFPSRYSPNVLSWQQFLWAHSSFVSRNLPLEPDANGHLRLTTGSGRAEQRQQCLLPLFDMLNHKYAAPIIWQSGGGGAGAVPTVGLAVGEDVEAGREIYNNYGPKSNQELLRLYGFVLEDNPQDTFELEVAGLAAEDEEELQAKNQLLAQSGLPRVHFLRRSTAAPASSGGVSGHPEVTGKVRSRKRQREAVQAMSVIPTSLLCVLRLAVLNQPELLLLLDGCSRNTEGQGHQVNQLLGAPISGRSEMAALRTLLNLLRAKLVKLQGDNDSGGSQHTHKEQACGTGIGDDANSQSLDGGADDDADDDEVKKGTVRSFIESAVCVYLRGQRELLQLGITECEHLLQTVAAATTHCYSWRDWQRWYDHVDGIRWPTSARPIGASRTRGQHRVRVSESTHFHVDQLAQGTARAYNAYSLSVADSALRVSMDAGVVRATSDVESGMPHHSLASHFRIRT